MTSNSLATRVVDYCASTQNVECNIVSVLVSPFRMLPSLHPLLFVPILLSVQPLK